MDGANPSGDLSGKSLSSNRQQPDAKALEHFPGFEKQGLDGSALPEDVRMIYTKKEFEALKEQRGIAELENQSNEAWKKNNKKWLYWMRKGYREDEAAKISEQYQILDMIGQYDKIVQSDIGQQERMLKPPPEQKWSSNPSWGASLQPRQLGQDTAGEGFNEFSITLRKAREFVVDNMIVAGTLFVPGPDDLLLAWAAGKGHKLIRAAIKYANGETKAVTAVLSKEGKLLSQAELEALRAEAKGVRKGNLANASSSIKRGAPTNLGPMSSKAPRQVTPGIRELEGQYIDDLGRSQPWRAHYDEFGRLIGRTDYNAGNRAAGIPDIHYERWEYNSQYPKGRRIENHMPGEFPQ